MKILYSIVLQTIFQVYKYLLVEIRPFTRMKNVPGTNNRLTDIQNCDIATLLISQIKPISELAYYIWNGILMSFNHCTWVLLIWWEQCLQCLLGKAIKVVCNYDFAHTVLLHMQQERKWSWLRRRTFWEGYLYFYPPMRNRP